MATFYELFAGVGLVREALEPLGWKCVYANDFDQSKQSIYAAKFPNREHLDGRNLWEVNVAELPRPVDLVAASFPCIDLSLAGKRGGLAGRHSEAFWAFVRVLEQLREDGDSPRALMVENVTGFLSSNEGRDFDTAVRTLNNLGYRVDVVQVSAEHFTPQSRPRLFVLGVRDDLASKVMTLPEDEIWWPRFAKSNLGIRPRRVHETMLKSHRVKDQASLFELLDTKNEDLHWGIIDFPELPHRTETFADIVDWLADSWWSAERTERALSEMAPLHRRRIQEMSERGYHQVATAYRRRRNGATVYEVRSDGVAGCLRTARGGSSTQIVVIVEGEDVRMRWMTPREYARLQGSAYPETLDTFRSAALRTAFGDAVCVPAVRWIAKHAFGSLLSEGTSIARKPSVHTS